MPSLRDDVVTDFVPFPAPPVDHGRDGPLDWPGYGAQRERAEKATNVSESVVCGRGRLGDHEAVVVCFEFGYLGGSIGAGTGARIADAFDHAVDSNLAVVTFISSGGTRMQEGMVALRQLQVLAHQCVRLREHGLPHIAVLDDPTTGGVWATLGSSADVVLALPGAQVAFAGRRVRAGAEADDPAYTAESHWYAGQVDELVDRDELRDSLAEWLSLLRGGSPEPAEVPRALGFVDEAPDGWQAVQRTRDPQRPRAEAYLDDYFEVRRNISGDRAGGVDCGMLCGIGRRGGRSIAFAAQTGTRTTPAGFRTATRLVRLAERLGLPVLTLVDTPGAAADPAAEKAGVGPALSELFTTIAAAQVPITTLVIGEGGSGGALAVCSTDRLWITPDAYFSVIAPEMAAAILKQPQQDVPDLAHMLKLRPTDLLRLGVVDGIAGR